MKNFLFSVFLAPVTVYLLFAMIPLMPDCPLGTGLHFRSVWHGIVALTAIFGLWLFNRR